MSSPPAIVAPETPEVDLTDLEVKGLPPARAASQLARIRWSKPENVERRVDALAEHIRRTVDNLPPLTEAQRARLAALLRPAETDGRAAA